MASLRISVLFLIVLFSSALAACGKTGPLYLPTDEPANPADSSQPSNESTID